jgi:hypothetical protein
MFFAFVAHAWGLHTGFVSSGWRGKRIKRQRGRSGEHSGNARHRCVAGALGLMDRSLFDFGDFAETLTVEGSHSM